MLRIILVVGAAVVYGAWKGFEGMTYARNAWGNFLFKGKVPFSKNDRDKNNND